MNEQNEWNEYTNVKGQNGVKGRSRQKTGEARMRVAMGHGTDEYSLIPFSQMIHQ